MNKDKIKGILLIIPFAVMILWIITLIIPLLIYIIFLLWKVIVAVFIFLILTALAFYGLDIYYKNG